MQLKGLLCCILARYGHMCLEFKKGDIQYVYSYSRIQHFIAQSLCVLMRSAIHLWDVCAPTEKLTMANLQSFEYVLVCFPFFSFFSCIIDSRFVFNRMGCRLNFLSASLYVEIVCFFCFFSCCKFRARKTDHSWRPTAESNRKKKECVSFQSVYLFTGSRIGLLLLYLTVHTVNWRPILMRNSCVCGGGGGRIGDRRRRM